TDITWLDRIGIPVFASIRPTAMDGSLCVNAGKGSTADEARVGALMEAIEFACAARTSFRGDVQSTTPRTIAEQPALDGDFAALCPLWTVAPDPEGSIDAVSASVFPTAAPILLPAELVFLPYPSNSGQTLFGTSSNGLCSGNTVKEALLHGLCEL